MLIGCNDVISWIGSWNWIKEISGKTSEIKIKPVVYLLMFWTKVLYLCKMFALEELGEWCFLLFLWVFCKSIYSKKYMFLKEFGQKNQKVPTKCMWKKFTLIANLYQTTLHSLPMHLIMKIFSFWVFNLLFLDDLHISNTEHCVNCYGL